MMTPLQKLTTFSLFYIMFFSLIIKETLHITTPTILFTMTASISFIILNLVYNQKLIKYQVVLSLLSLLLLSLSFYIWNNIYATNLYLAIITATIIYNMDKSLFKKLLLIALVIQTLLQIYEFLTLKYIFDYTLIKGDIEFTMSLDNLSFFRGKGLFPGALTAGSFAIYMAFIFRKNPYVLLLAFTSASLASTRLSVLTVFVIILLFIFQNNSIKIKYKIYFISTIILLVLLIVSLNSSEFINRLQNFADFNSDTNSLRIYYWTSGLYEFTQYPLINILLGKSNYFATIYGNSAESDWIMLLLETGIIGFLLYLIPIFSIIILSLAKQKYYLFLLILLWCIDIFLYRHISGIVSNVLHWYLLYDILDELNLKRKMKNEKSISS